MDRDRMIEKAMTNKARTTFLRTRNQRRWFLILVLGVPAAIAILVLYALAYGWKTAVGVAIGVVVFRYLLLGMTRLHSWVERGHDR